jgi:DNA-binding NtrC family response regulator
VLRSEMRQRAARARGGVLFVEHIEEASLEAQAELCGLLRNEDVRFIASTVQGIHDGRIVATTFGIRINVLALRDRPMDIPVLIDHFVRKFAQEYGKSIRAVQSATLKKLMAYPWPGNICELRDSVERAVVGSATATLGPDDFAFLVTAEEQRPLQFMIPGATIREIEKEAILRTLEHTGGSATAAAKMLKISVRKIQYKLKQYRNADDLNVTARAKAAAGGVTSSSF